MSKYDNVKVTYITEEDIIHPDETEEFDFTPVKVKYSSEWCECDNHRFHSYPGDGQCVCGVHKHHVHCFCGGISQVG